MNSSAPAIVDLLVAITRLMLRGSGEGSFHISSTVQRVARTYGVSADLEALPDSAMLVVRTNDGEWSAVIHEMAEIPRLDRAAELRELMHEIDGGRLSVEQALQRLERLGSSPALSAARSWPV